MLSRSSSVTSTPVISPSLASPSSPSQSQRSALAPKTSSYPTEQSASLVKSEGRTILKRFDGGEDNVEAAEELYTLCLFAKNRKAMIGTDILSVLALALKTKSDLVKEVVARTLELYAQDGGETCIALRRLNMCKASIEMITRVEDINVRIPIVGLVYWLAQSPSCKKEYLDMGADNYLRELSAKTKDTTLSKYLNYAINALSTSVKSREEMLEDILNRPIEVKSPALDHFEVFNPYASPSPIQVHNIFKSPSKYDSTSKRSENSQSLSDIDLSLDESQGVSIVSESESMPNAVEDREGDNENDEIMKDLNLGPQSEAIHIDTEGQNHSMKDNEIIAEVVDEKDIENDVVVEISEEAAAATFHNEEVQENPATIEEDGDAEEQSNDDATSAKDNEEEIPAEAESAQSKQKSGKKNKKKKKNSKK